MIEKSFKQHRMALRVFGSRSSSFSLPLLPLGLPLLSMAGVIEGSGGAPPADSPSTLVLSVFGGDDCPGCGNSWSSGVLGAWLSAGTGAKDGAGTTSFASARVGVGTGRWPGSCIGFGSSWGKWIYMNDKRNNETSSSQKDNHAFYMHIHMENLYFKSAHPLSCLCLSRWASSSCESKPRLREIPFICVDSALKNITHRTI